MGLLAGVDIGTSGAKVGIFRENGHLIGTGRSVYEHQIPEVGWAECDPDMWWKGLCLALRDAAENTPIDLHDISAFGIGVIFPAVAPLDAGHKPLYPAILYCDQRSVRQVETIKNAIPVREYQEIIGNTLVPGTCAITSIAWIRDELPEVYRTTAKFAFANSYVNYKLTGELATDPTNAALSGLVDIHDPWHWSEDLCTRLDVDIAKLPPIRDAGEVIGMVHQRAAEESGLRKGTPVVCGAGDAPLAVLGTGVMDTGTATYVAGSTDCVALPMTAPTPEIRVVNSAYIPRGKWLAIGTTTSSGASVEWFLREVLNETGPHGLETMNRLAACSPPGANGLVYCPYLQGERTPIWDPFAQGVFLGLTASTTKSDMARAVFEGVAFALRQTVECEEHAAGQIKTLKAVGGGTKSLLWNRIKADVLQRPFDILRFQEAGILGAALVAGKGAGVYRSYEHAIEMVQGVLVTETVEPQKSNAESYERVYSVYSQVYSETKSLMYELTQIRLKGKVL